MFYLSMRLGDFEGFQGERYFSCYSEKELRYLVERAVCFTVVKGVGDPGRTVKPSEYSMD